MAYDTLPVGRLPMDLLARLPARAPVNDPRVILGPGIGLDCAVVEAGIAAACAQVRPYHLRVRCNCCPIQISVPCARRALQQRRPGLQCAAGSHGRWACCGAVGAGIGRRANACG